MSDDKGNLIRDLLDEVIEHLYDIVHDSQEEASVCSAEQALIRCADLADAMAAATSKSGEFIYSEELRARIYK